MSDDLQKDIESIHETMLKTQAMCFALESLCVALAKTAPDPEALVAQFEVEKELLLTSTLFDGELLDAVTSAFSEAHDKISRLIAPSS